MKKVVALVLSLIIILPLLMASAIITGANAEERLYTGQTEGWMSSEMFDLVKNSLLDGEVLWIYCRLNENTVSASLEVSGGISIPIQGSVRWFLKPNGESTVEYSAQAVASILTYIQDVINQPNQEG